MRASGRMHATMRGVALGSSAGRVHYWADWADLVVWLGTSASKRTGEHNGKHNYDENMKENTTIIISNASDRPIDRTIDRPTDRSID